MKIFLAYNHIFKTIQLELFLNKYFLVINNLKVIYYVFYFYLVYIYFFDYFFPFKIHPHLL